jgi:gamma-glutamyltranspeptidase/glutathione hydrolase
MHSSFGMHEKNPGGLVLNESMPPWSRKELGRMGYKITIQERTSGPINAIWFDRQHGTFWGGSSNHGEDYGIGW